MMARLRSITPFLFGRGGIKITSAREIKPEQVKPVEMSAETEWIIQHCHPELKEQTASQLYQKVRELVTRQLWWNHGSMTASWHRIDIFPGETVSKRWRESLHELWLMDEIMAILEERECDRERLSEVAS